MSLAKKIAVQLYWKFRSSSDFILPRYTPPKWWECDLWRLTKSGKVDEYEIKLSVADFRADVKKQSMEVLKVDPLTHRLVEEPPMIKHQLLKDGDTSAPNRFWFVVPSEIAGRIVVPSYAGLMIFHRGHPWIEKQAPKIHNKKWEGDRVRLLHTFYHRYWAHESKSKDGEITPTVEPES